MTNQPLILGEFILKYNKLIKKNNHGTAVYYLNKREVRQVKEFLYITNPNKKRLVDCLKCKKVQNHSRTRYFCSERKAHFTVYTRYCKCNEFRPDNRVY